MKAVRYDDLIWHKAFFVHKFIMKLRKYGNKNISIQQSYAIFIMDPWMGLHQNYAQKQITMLCMGYIEHEGEQTKYLYDRCIVGLLNCQII
jgi:hypothetical protein